MDKYIPIGEVVGIYFQDKKGGPNRLIEQGYFKKDKGLVCDIHFGHSRRQVSLFTVEGKKEIQSLDTKGLCTERFHENIRVKDLDLDKLKVGVMIKIGETIHEVTEIGKRCFPECEIIKRGNTCSLSKQVFFTRVIKDGQVNIHDKILVI
ncbi:MOSC domain-containing protein [Schnuerera sp. xch1]|uniref:MOSC domain-containing protein n=1 Tax=Schnuerera sp. xch1 TaxID=2874283 RepID=UPI001CBC7B4F|nr:MOSC domain-containing protein [Schnuerera sp. xch1]MBZ2174729.1 MOSC domain-containing protein [Schnuerera sp. xch1]